MKKLLSLMLCLALTLGLTLGAASAAFTDQGTIRYSEAVNRCAALNIIGGYADGSFQPNRPVTRAELSKMLSVLLGGGKTPALSGSGNTFADTRGHWASQYVEYCARRDIVAGVGGGRFDPNGNVTGTQAAKMLLVILGFDPADRGYVGSSLWAENINRDASAAGLYQGIASFQAAAPLTRDQSAQMIWNALNSPMVGNQNKTLLAHYYPNFTFPSAPDPVPETPSKILLDYIGMREGELTRLWGSDYRTTDWTLFGAEKGLYYQDLRVPVVFYLTGGVVTGVDCSAVAGSGFRLTEQLTGQETGTQLCQLGGSLMTDGDSLGADFDETAALYYQYQGKTIYFSWLDKDPYTTAADSIVILP